MIRKDENKVTWQVAIYGGRRRDQVSRYSDHDPIFCFRCGQPVGRPTGSFSNICRCCSEAQLPEVLLHKNDVTRRKPNSETSAKENRNKQSKRCPFCEQEFVPKRTHARFCSNRCSAACHFRKLCKRIGGQDKLLDVKHRKTPDGKSEYWQCRVPANFLSLFTLGIKSAARVEAACKRNNFVEKKQSLSQQFFLPTSNDS